MIIKKIFLVILLTTFCLAEIATENISLTSSENISEKPKNNVFSRIKLGVNNLSDLEFAKNEDEKNKFPDRLTSYRPIYYIDALQHNPEAPNAMVCISFKYRVISDLELFFGYTQLMFWDRDQESSPFKDINYNPELYYKWYLENNILKSIDIGLYEHRSNGRDKEDSRSWDRQYIQFNTEHEYLAWFNIKQVIKFNFKYFKLWEGLLGDNRDIGKYIGNTISRITIDNYFDSATFKETELYYEFFFGGQSKLDSSMGGSELGFIFNFELFGLNPRIYIQSFNGYGHSLLTYNQIEHAIRLGLIII